MLDNSKTNYSHTNASSSNFNRNHNTASGSMMTTRSMRLFNDSKRISFNMVSPREGIEMINSEKRKSFQNQRKISKISNSCHYDGN